MFHPRPELSTGGVAARNAPLTTKKIDTTAARSASVHWTDKMTIPTIALKIPASSRTHHCLLTASAAGRSIATRVTGLNMGVPSGPPLRRARLRGHALLTRTVSTDGREPTGLEGGSRSCASVEDMSPNLRIAGFASRRSRWRRGSSSLTGGTVRDVTGVAWKHWGAGSTAGSMSGALRRGSRAPRTRSGGHRRPCAGFVPPWPRGGRPV
jgi:hypothetical protein